MDIPNPEKKQSKGPDWRIKPKIEQESNGEVLDAASRGNEAMASQQSEINITAPSIPVVEKMPAPKTVLEQEIESILEEDIDDIFWNLPEQDRDKFKQNAEVASNKIFQLLSQVAVKVQEIFKIIADWLKTLPGANSFFVEKEAKIKTDKILRLKK